MRLRFLIGFAALALLAVASGPGPANATEATLATGGDVYFVEQGLYGELFPDGAEAAVDAPVLAINVLRGDGSAERLLVPGTEGAEVDRAASLVPGPNGDAVHLLWQAGTETSRLRLSSLSAQGWGDEVDVSRGSPVVDGTPRLVATRDDSRLEAPGEGEGEGEAVVRRRSVLHVAWLEDGGEAVYAPVVLESGVYLGDHSLFELSQFAPEGLVPTETAAASGAAAAPPAILTLEPGQEGAVVAAFTDPVSEQLVSLELRPIAGELSEVGDRLRDGILELTEILEPGDPESLDSLAGGARAHLIGVGRHLRPAVLGILAAEVDRYVRETGGDWSFQPEIMAARTRAHVISVGASFDHTPIVSLHAGGRAHLIGVGHHLEAPDRSHDLSVRATASRPVPELPPQSIGTVYLSASGSEALLAWESEGLIQFRESAGESWGPVVTLGIEADSDPSLVRDLLSRRVNGN